MELKNTLKVIGISLLGVLGIGMSCYSHSVGMTLLSPNYEKVGAYYVESYSDSVTFSAEELNNCSYEYLKQKSGFDTQSNFTETYIIYNNTTFSFDDYDVGNIYYQNGDDTILFVGEDSCDWQYKENGVRFDFEYSMTIYSSFFADNMAKSTTISAQNLNNNTYEYFGSQLNDLMSDTPLESSYIIIINNIT